ncbi:MAG: YqgE/AlgH family protein [Thermoanaerobaculia bacterium]|nr:YqgE/AlgH family protein [Thermoanaerobaculia bacterium]
MPAAVTELVAPALLVAMPQVQDASFHKSVVLLVHHDEEGSLGFVLNRVSPVKIAEIFEGLTLSWWGDRDALADLGGPVQPQLGTVLFAAGGSTPEVALSAASELTAGLSLTQHVGDLARLAEQPPRRFRLLLGYAGWGEGQLVDEILRNDWLVVPISAELVFDDHKDELWERSLRSVGVDPGILPSWTSANHEDHAN